MPRKASIPEITDISKIVIETHERLDALEKKGGVDHERISVLEHNFQNMNGLPATVAALGQEVKSLDASMKREVDGLREQQKAHKIETAEMIEKGFALVGEQVQSIGRKVDNLMVTDIRQKSWWELIEKFG